MSSCFDQRSESGIFSDIVGKFVSPILVSIMNKFSIAASGVNYNDS